MALPISPCDFEQKKPEKTGKVMKTNAPSCSPWLSRNYLFHSNELFILVPSSALNQKSLYMQFPIYVYKCFTYSVNSETLQCDNEHVLGWECLDQSPSVSLEKPECVSVMIIWTAYILVVSMTSISYEQTEPFCCFLWWNQEAELSDQILAKNYQKWVDCLLC